MGKWLRRIGLISVWVLCLCGAFGQGSWAGGVGDSYEITQSIPLGAPERWDYLSFDAASNRVFAAHGDRIDVIDLSTQQVVGGVAVAGANGSANRCYLADQGLRRSPWLGN